MKSVSIPDAITHIGRYAFSSCDTLEEVSFSKNVVEIGDSAFSHSGIKNIVVPESVKTVGASAAQSCFAMKEVVVGNGVTNIANYAFSDCIRLEKLVLGSGIEKIGNSIVVRCSKIQAICYAGTEEMWAEIEMGSNNNINSTNIIFEYEG